MTGSSDGCVNNNERDWLHKYDSVSDISSTSIIMSYTDPQTESTPQPIPIACSMAMAHYLIPTVATIFGVTFLLIGVTTGGWLFYSVGGVVLLLALWGFRMATRQIQLQTVQPEVANNPLQKVTLWPTEDPAPPV
jgi:hypothetical protein